MIDAQKAIELVESADRYKHSTPKEMLTQISKDTYTDLIELAGSNTVSKVDYEVSSLNSKANNVAVTALNVTVGGDDWEKKDSFFVVYNRTSVSVKNVEKVINDMVNYCIINVFKINKEA